MKEYGRNGFSSQLVKKLNPSTPAPCGDSQTPSGLFSGSENQNHLNCQESLYSRGQGVISTDCNDNTTRPVLHNSICSTGLIKRKHQKPGLADLSGKTKMTRTYY